MLDGFADDVNLHVGRDGDVDDLDLLVGHQFCITLVHRIDPVPFRDKPSMFGVPRSDGHGIEAGLAIRHQLAVGHNEARTDAADSNSPVRWQTGEVIEVE